MYRKILIGLWCLCAVVASAATFILRTRLHSASSEELRTLYVLIGLSAIGLCALIPFVLARRRIFVSILAGSVLAYSAYWLVFIPPLREHRAPPFEEQQRARYLRRAHQLLGHVRMIRPMGHQVSSGRQVQRTAKSIFEYLGDDAGVTWATLSLGLLELDFGHYERALDALEEAAERARGTESSKALAQALRGLAAAYTGMGEFQCAREQYFELNRLYSADFSYLWQNDVPVLLASIDVLEAEGWGDVPSLHAALVRRIDVLEHRQQMGLMAPSSDEVADFYTRAVELSEAMGKSYAAAALQLRYAEFLQHERTKGHWPSHEAYIDAYARFRVLDDHRGQARAMTGMAVSTSNSDQLLQYAVQAAELYDSLDEGHSAATARAFAGALVWRNYRFLGCRVEGGPRSSGCLSFEFDGSWTPGLLALLQGDVQSSA